MNAEDSAGHPRDTGFSRIPFNKSTVLDLVARTYIYTPARARPAGARVPLVPGTGRAAPTFPWRAPRTPRFKYTWEGSALPGRREPEDWLARFACSLPVRSLCVLPL